MPLLRSKVVWILAGFALSVGASTSRLTAQQGTATVTGVVTDATTQRPIQGAQVVIAGTNLSALSNQSGRYLILDAPVGARDVRVQLRWYGPLTRSVTLTAGSSAVTDFALTPSVVDLEGTTVNTITGMRRRNRERGTSSGLLEVASDITPAAVTSVSDILSGRMEGLVLQDMGGTVGTSQRIRIRGATSLSLLNEPLVYLDGVRMNTNGQEGLIAVGGQEPSRLNDINPNDIASIEVLRGAAAAALYGTGAANGVLLITTKRGAAGDAKWDFYAEYGQLEDRTAYGTSYVTNSIVDATQPFTKEGSGINAAAYPFCSNRDVADGLCVQQISQDFNGLLDPRTTPFTKGFTRKFGMSVAGGDDRTTYYISGEISDEVGVIDYNTEDKFNVRANLQTAIRDDLDAFVTFGYTASQLDLSFNDITSFSPVLNGLLGEGVFFEPTTHDSDPVNRRNFGFGLAKAELKEFVTMQDIDRFTLGMNSSYRPLTWLTSNLNMGLDFTVRHDFRTLRREARVPVAVAFIGGSRRSARTENVLYTGNGSLSATRELNDVIVSTSTAGLSYQKSQLNRTECFGRVLLPGTTSCGTTSRAFSVDEDFSQEVTVGGFFQQQFAMWDRLFVSGSIRGDDNSGFGELAGWEYYPSAEVSWVVGEEGWFPQASWIGDVRVRAAFGVSGLPPAFRQATALFDPVTVSLDDEDVPGISLGETGDALLEPERTTEYEIGFDAGLLGDRIGLHYTYFTKTSKDVLIERRLAPSLGLTETGFRNLAQLSNSGHEIGVNVVVIDRTSVALDLDVATSFFNNEVDDLGRGTPDIILNRGDQRHQVGRAAGSFFQREVFFDDADGNGKLSLSEVTLGDTAVFLGEALPQWQTSVNVGLRLWDWIRVTSLFEGRGGNRQLNDSEAFKCAWRATRGCAAVADPNASLEEQARYVADRFLGSSAGFIEDASFIRWRELSVTLRAPASLARDVPGLDALSFTVAGRNLNIWTDYSGIDPEVVDAGADSNFNQSELGTQPPVRSIVFRLNYAF